MINSFLQNSSELNERNKLQDQIFAYMLQKHILHHQPNLSLPNGILILEEQNQCGQQHPSTVYYKELLTENPDCDETMSLVAED